MHFTQRLLQVRLSTFEVVRLSNAIVSEEPDLYDHARTILQSMLDEFKPAKQKIVLEIDEYNE